MARNSFYKVALPLTVLALSLAAGPSAAQTGQTPAGQTPAPATRTPAISGNTLSSQDRSFILKAAESGMAEVETGKLAQQKAQSQQVKDFANRMVQDHTKANDRLMQIARDKGVDVPAKLDKSGQKELDALNRLSGPQFDRTYTKREAADHKKVIQDFEKQVRSGKDPDVKRFAQETLPILEEHHKLAEAAAGSVTSGGR